jgi:nucleotide-binding universal stress UspA family protein
MNILVAIDGSEHSRFQIEAVASRPWPASSTIRILSVAQIPAPPSAEGFGAAQVSQAYLEVERLMTIEGQAVVNRAADALRGSGHAIEPVVRIGDPRAEIIEEAKRSSADLIVVGWTGKNALKRLVLGSVAEYIVRHAPCSVEVVRPPQRAAAAGSAHR